MDSKCITIAEKIALSIPEAAALCSISAPTMRKWANMAGFPAVKIGGRIIIARAELEAWISRQAGGGDR